MHQCHKLFQVYNTAPNRVQNWRFQQHHFTLHKKAFNRVKNIVSKTRTKTSKSARQNRAQLVPLNKPTKRIWTPTTTHHRQPPISIMLFAERKDTPDGTSNQIMLQMQVSLKLACANSILDSKAQSIDLNVQNVAWHKVAQENLRNR